MAFIDTFLNGETGSAIRAIINALVGRGNGTGWADYVDDQYTSGSPLSLAADTATVLPNNAATVRETQKPQDVNTFYTPASLAYDGGTQAFTIGETVTGGSSGATAEIQEISGDASSGLLFLGEITGTFTNNEAITGTTTGAALANGTNGAGKITGRNGDGLAVTIDFVALPTNAGTTYLECWIDIGGAVGEIYKRIVSFPKGNGVVRPINFTVDGYTLDTWEANGGTVYVKANNTADLYNIRYVLTRTHMAR